MQVRVWPSFTVLDFIPPMKGLNEEEQQTGYYNNVFPNLFLSISPNHVGSLITTPMSAGRTRQLMDVLVPKELMKDYRYLTGF